MLKVVMKDGSYLDIPEGATVILDSMGSDKDAVMTARVNIPNVTGVVALKPGETLNELALGGKRK